MRRHNVYRQILRHCLSLTQGFSQEDIDILEASIDNDALVDIDYDFILNKLPNDKEGCKRIIKKLQSISNQISDEDEVRHSNNCEYLFIEKSYIQRQYNFEYVSAKIACVNVSEFFREDLNDCILAPLERICATEAKIPGFIAKLNDEATTAGGGFLIAYDSVATPNVDRNKPERLFNYVLLSYFDYKKTLTNSPLLSAPLLPSVNPVYDNTCPYCQYSDIYEIINDWNTATNLLDSFLRMYHVIEYMVYRLDLAKFVDGANIKKSFLRQVKYLDKQFHDNERKKIVDGYKNLFYDVFLVDTDLKGDNSDIIFCQKYCPDIKLTKLGDTAQRLTITASFIYGVRCMIVHSKESEFHITLTNIEEYSVIIPLMTKLITEIRKKVFNLLSDPNSDLIFSKDSIDLY